MGSPNPTFPTRTSLLFLLSRGRRAGVRCGGGEHLAPEATFFSFLLRSPPHHSFISAWPWVGGTDSCQRLVTAQAVIRTSRKRVCWEGQVCCELAEELEGAPRAM